MKFHLLYTGASEKGPIKLFQIDPHWKACGNGKMQSPIDLLDCRVQVFPSLGKSMRDYQPAPAVVKTRTHDNMVSCLPTIEAILCYPFSWSRLLLCTNSVNVYKLNITNA